MSAEELDLQVDSHSAPQINKTPERLAAEHMYRNFYPPLARGMRVLDRSVFKKSVPMTAAKILDLRMMGEIRKNCKSDWFNPPFQVKLQRMIEDEQGRKSLLLKPDAKKDDLSTVSEAMRGYIEKKVLELTDYTLELDYDAWNYAEIIAAILPEELSDELPQGFTRTGHIAHLNLREQYQPYKKIIGEILLDKNRAHIRTVISKLDMVGVASKFRTFPMEVLAGDEDTQVEVHELDCTYSFDFRDVYWNSRLEHEHRRIVDKCQPGEAVCDVMAGVGPFAMPLGKKRVITWANDLNPESYKALLGNIQTNKVQPFVFASNDDGALHIRQSVRKLYKLAHSPSNRIAIPLSAKAAKQARRAEIVAWEGQKPAPEPTPVPGYIPVPETFSHFIMNLPDSAITFLGAFIGSHYKMEHLFTPHTQAELPFVHVYCFQRPVDDEQDLKDIAERCSKYLQFNLDPSAIDLHYVRLVAPNKRMYCASFRLPKEVAFADPASVIQESDFTPEQREELERLIRWEIIQ
ncbi:hypothetical protein BJ508DRAFT_413968 [Ascobolus immersus RN42]|uniref:tRNA (guanine(37)-N1)-methyltransferase n=1 Tax=Ascobolus immersus RN42 TaxID=1160509 RepID=A0A3N4IBH3_ASCIM|nr:hypothetical protein BJ508DRAFT_413968 [Ascobolus immersus RN42]